MGLILDTLYGATLIPHYLWHRLKTDKYGSAAPEKLAKINLCPKESGKKRLWIHGVSVGEAIAAKPLVKSFHEKFPDWDIKISTTTHTGRDVAIKNFGKGNVFYYPLDIRRIVRKTFEIVDPDMIILMELEVWPHFLELAEKLSVPVAVSNVRITEKSFRNFKRLGNLSKKLLNRITLWASQSEDYSRILRELGVAEEKIYTVGSLKYDGLDFSKKNEVKAKLLDELGGGRIFLAGSTHDGEDEIILKAFEIIREKAGSDIRLLLVPRHPERCESVIKKIPVHYKVARRSEGKISNDTDIIVGDTMGELAGMYRVADVVFVAGSLSEKVGGHNMLEPAAFGKPVIYGPYTFNFKDPAEILEAAGGAVRLTDNSADALGKKAAEFFNDAGMCEKYGAAAKKACMDMQGAAARTIDLLADIIGKTQ